MSLQEWLDAVLGRAIDVDGAYGAQCVDLVNDYLQRCWATGRVSGNAVDIARQAIRGFRWQANARLNAPPAGSIVVWGHQPVGHTAVCIWASPMTLITLDQNWAGIQRAEVVVHSYGAVLGWHRRA